MKTSLRYREVIADVRRVVVKVGSRVLVQKTGRPDVRRMRSLIRELSRVRTSGRDVVIVTSGAIGAGTEALRMRERPTALPDLQMAAAVGQTRLMSRYAEMFGAAGCTVGQMLLTHGDFHHKMRLTNARRTMENLLRNGVVPIVNENDVVADEEIRADLAFGDNDNLAALTVKLIRADLLIILTTVDGVRAPGASGRTRRVRYLETINRRTFDIVKAGASAFSKGGMASKLKAAQAASQAGCSVVIANGRMNDVITRILDGEDVGTLIVAS
ncbi:MAG: glutamate 5-kinase [Lentisphaerae bacterium]|nr:glutamate 5-kinase [Lentisphaerota bacterium]